MKQKVIISTDCALDSLFHDPDDALALLYLLQSSLYEVESIITTFGNTTEEMVFKSIQELFKITGYKTKVIRGAKSKNDTNFSAIDYLNTIQATCYTLVSIGPLTNFKYLSKEKLTEFNNLFVMGGAVKIAGNRPPTFKAEFNLAQDAKAAGYVFGSRPISCVPLDATRKINIDTFFIQRLTKKLPELGTKINRWNLLNKFLFFRKGLNPHDLILTIAMTNPELFNVRKRGIEIRNAQTIENSKFTPIHNIFFIENSEPVYQIIKNWL